VEVLLIGKYFLLPLPTRFLYSLKDLQHVHVICAGLILVGFYAENRKQVVSSNLVLK
jgi:hypothetical protein